MNDPASWIIGGERDCDLVVEDSSVSRRHCRLRRQPDGTFILEDLGSTNGTFVNGRRIEAPTPVERTDVIRLARDVPMPWPEIVETADPSGTGPILRVGREPDNDVVLDHPEVSAYHARVELAADLLSGVVEDLGSTNGTSINGPGPKVKRAAIVSTDIVYFGPVAVRADAFFSRTTATPAEPVESELVVRGDALIVGRDPSCDVVLNLPVISARHARVLRDGRAFRIEDLGSSNGTFVNGRPIGKSARVRPGDRIGLGPHEVTLVDGTPERTTSKGNWPPIAVRIAVVLQYFLVAVVVLLTTKPSTPGVWFGLAIGSFWIGLSFGWFERFVFSGSTRRIPAARSELAHLASFLLRVGILDLLFCLTTYGILWGRDHAGFSPAGLAILWVTALIGSALGDLIARLTGRWSIALGLAVVLVAVMGIFSSPARTLPMLGAAGRAVSEACPTRWAFEALLDLSAGETSLDLENDPVERYYPATTDRMGPLACSVALLAMLGGLIALDALTARSAADRSPRDAPAWR